jgi:hypothetical protein
LKHSIFNSQKKNFKIYKNKVYTKFNKFIIYKFIKFNRKFKSLARIKKIKPFFLPTYKKITVIIKSFSFFYYKRTNYNFFKFFFRAKNLPFLMLNNNSFSVYSQNKKKSLFSGARKEKKLFKADRLFFDSRKSSFFFKSVKVIRNSLKVIKKDKNFVKNNLKLINNKSFIKNNLNYSRAFNFFYKTFIVYRIKYFINI